MDMKELIQQHLEVKKQMNILEEQDALLKEQILLLMKQQNITFFEDDIGNTAKYSEQTRESVDKDRVKELLGEIRFAEVVKTTTFNTLKVTSKEQRENVKKLAKRKEQ